MRLSAKKLARFHERQVRRELPRVVPPRDPDRIPHRRIVLPEELREKRYEQRLPPLAPFGAKNNTVYGSFRSLTWRF